MNRKLRTAIFWAVLALGVGLGAPYDPKKTEEIVRIMNTTKIEVVLEKGDPAPDFDAMMEAVERKERQGVGAHSRQETKREVRMGRLKNMVCALREWLQRDRKQLEP
jgi:hypothetical protein